MSLFIIAEPQLLACHCCTLYGFGSIVTSAALEAGIPAEAGKRCLRAHIRCSQALCVPGVVSPVQAWLGVPGAVRRRSDRQSLCLSYEIRFIVAAQAVTIGCCSCVSCKINGLNQMHSLFAEWSIKYFEMIFQNALVSRLMPIMPSLLLSHVHVCMSGSTLPPSISFHRSMKACLHMHQSVLKPI